MVRTQWCSKHCRNRLRLWNGCPPSAAPFQVHQKQLSVRSEPKWEQLSVPRSEPKWEQLLAPRSD